MSRNHTLGQALVDIGNVVEVHHLPDLIGCYPRHPEFTKAPALEVHVRVEHLPAWRSAFRATDNPPEPRSGGITRISASAYLAGGAVVEVYTFEAPNDDTDN